MKIDLNLEKQFEEYLINIEDFKKGSAKTYVEALKEEKISKLSNFKDVFLDRDFSDSIFSVNDLQEFTKIKQILTSSSNFDEVNRDTYRQALNASLNKYENFLEMWFDKKFDHQRIFYGAPGTGKSYQLNKEAEGFFGNNFERVSFYQSYTYNDFVGGFNEENSYYEPGAFIKQLVKAYENPGVPFGVLIEEINRGNVLNIFAENLQLLNRNIYGESEYSVSTPTRMKQFFNETIDKSKMSGRLKSLVGEDFERLVLPSNFYVWATMDIVKVGVENIDIGFKRRWEFTYFGINDAAIENKNDFDEYIFEAKDKFLLTWDYYRRTINEKLSKLNIEEDKMIGSYFISNDVLEGSRDDLKKSIKNNVLMYLYYDVAKDYKEELFSKKCSRSFTILCEEFEKDVMSIFKKE